VFVKECSTILKKAGFAVDYYKGEDVTVEFYRNLPTYRYDLIVFRVHSADMHIHEYPSLAMFTSEPYSTKRYVYEQLRNRVACGYLGSYREGDPYLVVTDKFVRFSMKGLFKDTVIIMMGCSSIKRCMATAFLEKGARACIGWDGPVSSGYTDRVTIRFLKHLLVEKQTIARSVRQTMEEVGREYQYGSTLLFWPIKAGNITVKR
jgi:hypothetical protein